MGKFFLGLGFERKLDVGLLARFVGQPGNFEINVVQACLVRLLRLLVSNVNRRSAQRDFLDGIDERFAVCLWLWLRFRRFGLSGNAN